jgi:hypothetical protein
MRIRLDEQRYDCAHAMSYDQVTGTPDHTRTKAFEVSVETTETDPSIHQALRSPWFEEVCIYSPSGHAKRHNVDALLLSLVNNRRTTMLRLVQVRFHKHVLTTLLTQIETLLLEDCHTEGGDDLIHLVDENED